MQDIFWLAGVRNLIFAILAVFCHRSGWKGVVWLFRFQTLWTDLYMMIEHWVQGERPWVTAAPAKGPWSREKLIKVRRDLRDLVTGGVLDRPDFYYVLGGCANPGGRFSAGPCAFSAYFTTLFLTTHFTFVMAGLAREQVCVYMCPYARFQERHVRP